jgi:colanic acid biosynthesis glycosyl transferase WcaI
VDAPNKTFLIISQVYVPDPASVGQHMHDAAAAMARRGWRVVVLASARGYDDPSQVYPAHEERDGVQIRRFPLSSFGKSSIAARLAGGLIFLFQAILYGLFVRDLKGLLVSTSPPMCSIAGTLIHMIRRVPVKFWAMDINPDQMIAMGKIGPRSAAARVFDWLNRGILRRASDVIALDRFMAQALERKIPIGDKTTIIPPWPHIDGLDSILPHADNPFRARHGLRGKFVVMYSGNISPAHPVTTVLEAARQLQDQPQLVFLFIGGGLGVVELQRFVKQHQLTNVRFLPYQPLSELRYSLSAADVHLVSMGDEMVGIVHPCKVYGAMAVGRPVLMLGPTPCHVSDILDAYGVGWRIEHGDIEGAQRQIGEMLSVDPASLERMGQVAQAAIAQKFSREVLCAAFCDALERGTRSGDAKRHDSRA